MVKETRSGVTLKLVSPFQELIGNVDQGGDETQQTTDKIAGKSLRGLEAMSVLRLRPACNIEPEPLSDAKCELS